MLGITFHGGIRCVVVVLWRDPFPHPRATWRSSKWGNGAAPTDKNFLFAWPPRKFWKESCSTTVITFRSDFIYQPTITTRLVLVKFIQSTGHQPGTVSSVLDGEATRWQRIEYSMMMIQRDLTNLIQLFRKTTWIAVGCGIYYHPPPLECHFLVSLYR